MIQFLSHKLSTFSNLYKEEKNIKTFDKISFATEITKSKNSTKDNMSKCLDLEKKIKKLTQFIEKSNSSSC